MNPIYEKAEEILLKHGWCKEKYMDKKGRICLATAIRLAEGFPLDKLQAAAKNEDGNVIVWPGIYTTGTTWTRPSPAIKKFNSIVLGGTQSSEEFNNQDDVKLKDIVASLQIAAAVI